MQRKKLGADLNVSAMGLGCMGMSEFYGPRDDAQAIQVLDAVNPVAAVQTEYSLWTRDVEDAVLPTCRKLDTGLVTYPPA